jgi:sorting nexin-3/12
MIKNEVRSAHESEFTTDYYTPEYIAVVVSDAINHEENGKISYTSYKITTNTTFPEYKLKEFSVRRRYKEFVWLRNHLKEKLEEKGKRLTLANLPGNTISSLLGPGNLTTHLNS